MDLLTKCLSYIIIECSFREFEPRSAGFAAHLPKEAIMANANIGNIVATFTIKVEYGRGYTKDELWYACGGRDNVPDGLVDHRGFHLERAYHEDLVDVPKTGTHTIELSVIDMRHAPSDLGKQYELACELKTRLGMRFAVGEETLALALDRTNSHKLPPEITWATCVARSSFFRMRNGTKQLTAEWDQDRWRLGCWGVWTSSTDSLFLLGVKL